MSTKKLYKLKVDPVRGTIGPFYASYAIKRGFNKGIYYVISVLPSEYLVLESTNGASTPTAGIISWPYLTPYLPVTDEMLEDYTWE